MRRASAMKSTR